MTEPDEPGDLISQVAAVGSDLAPALGVPDAVQLLTAVCATAKGVFGAAACSVAELDEDEGLLRYRASAGEGADAVVGLTLPVDRGLGGFVALSGMALSVEEVQADPRFAADVAEQTGYVPTAILAVPLVDDGGVVLGVLSILDRDEDAVAAARALDLATAFAHQAALALRVGIATRAMGSVLLGAVADAVAEGDADLAAALRTRAADRHAPHAEVAALAAQLAELRELAPGLATTAGKIVDELLTYANAARGRRR